MAMASRLREVMISEDQYFIGLSGGETLGEKPSPLVSPIRAMRGTGYPGYIMKRLTEGLLGEVTGQSVHHSEEGQKKKREMSV